MKQILFFATLITINIAATAQFKSLKEKVLGEKNPLAGFLKKPAPITTNFEDDVKMEGSLPETFGNDKTYIPLYKMPAAANGGFVLCPGFYEMTNMSYCLKAGTHGPSEGDGYMYAPTKGKMDDIVNAILTAHQNKHAEIPQKDVQVLLWAIIARSKFKNLSGRLKVVAGVLLTPEQIIKLNGGLAETLSSEALDRGLVDLPAPVRTVMEAENNIRRLVETGVDSYEDFERFAVLAGMATVDRADVKRGMWSLHPDGFYVRYRPNGYSRTTVQVYVPDAKGQIIYNAISTIACPANTGAQRLAQTNRPLQKTDEPFTDPCGKQ
ncbi:MAG: hypothetical protein RLZZ316_2372 [Bacteroidota bacterium]|jgi:hypothetical protein